MGTWGTGNFENDTACDWAYKLEECHDLSVIEEAIDAVLETDYIDVESGSEALAAIDTLARLRGSPGVQDSYTENVDRWVEKNRPDVPAELVEKARLAIQLIIGENSELLELWAEEEEADTWKGEIEGLLRRLGN